MSASQSWAPVLPSSGFAASDCNECGTYHLGQPITKTRAVQVRVDRHRVDMDQHADEFVACVVDFLKTQA